MPRTPPIRERGGLSLGPPALIRGPGPRRREPAADRPGRPLQTVVLAWLAQQYGWLISAAVHLAASVALAVVVWTPQVEEPVAALNSALLSDEPAVQPFDTPLPMMDLSGLESERDLPDAFASAADLPREPAGTVNAGMLGGLGLGDGDGGTGGGAGQIGFFGTNGTGNSVVFVVDMSGSMEGSRFGRARQELIRSIVALKSTQKFYVIFFNAKTFPLFHPKPAAGLVAATPLVKRRATRWINSHTPGANTEPIPALQMALALKPDIIYFLTDGEIPPYTEVVAKEQNVSKVAINTIAFQGRQGEAILRAIAEASGGTYRYVK